MSDLCLMAVQVSPHRCVPSARSKNRWRALSGRGGLERRAEFSSICSATSEGRPSPRCWPGDRASLCECSALDERSSRVRSQVPTSREESSPPASFAAIVVTSAGPTSRSASVRSVPVTDTRRPVDHPRPRASSVRSVSSTSPSNARSRESVRMTASTSSHTSTAVSKPSNRTRPFANVCASS